MRRFYNHTPYSGLETHILNSYTNPLVQSLHYIHPIRSLAKSHITTNCLNEHCLLCELGFVSRMLEDAKGTNCQSSNFCRTVGILAQGESYAPSIHLPSNLSLSASHLIELVDYGRETTEVDYSQKIQIFHRFLLDHLTSEGNMFPNNPQLVKRRAHIDQTLAPAPITQLVGVDAKNVIVCQNCHAVREKENMTHVVDLVYPRKVYFWHYLYDHWLMFFREHQGRQISLRSSSNPSFET
jgi:Ubiquitin carboxyl-terminal hydrolase.